MEKNKSMASLSQTHRSYQPAVAISAMKLQGIIDIYVFDFFLKMYSPQRVGRRNSQNGFCVVKYYVGATDAYIL